MKFVGNPQTIGVGDHVWKTCADMLAVALDGKKFTVPSNFYFDGCSSPRILHTWFPPDDGIYGRAVLLHDYLVRNRRLLDLSLADCHGYFGEALRACGVDPERAKAMYMAVYIFNWFSAGPGDGTPPKGMMRRVKYIELEAAL